MWLDRGGAIQKVTWYITIAVTNRLSTTFLFFLLYAHSAMPDSSAASTVPHALVPQPVPDAPPLDHSSLYFNRELSWIDFNWRVLDMARDPHTPLMERIRFVGVAASNLDGFVRKRVGGLKRQVADSRIDVGADGRTSEEQLALIMKAVQAQHEAIHTTWADIVAPAADQEIGLRICNWEALSPAEHDRLTTYMHTHIKPILTPLAVDPGRPFPFISNMSLSLAVVLTHPKKGTEHFARVKIPKARARWIPLNAPLQFVGIESLVAAHIDVLFPGMQVEGVYPFRVTRNAEVPRDETDTDDLLDAISERLRERRFAPVVRLEVDGSMPTGVQDFLQRKLRVSEEDVFVTTAPLDLTDVDTLADLHVPDARFERSLRFPSWLPVAPAVLPARRSTSDSALFETIRSGDVLLHHPYHSFQDSVQRFIETATRDPDVLAIKMTLYRTSEDSPIVKALINAAERGTQVAVLIEVKARFDEEKNIAWGRKLEDAGVHVAYGVMGLKTHAQVTLVVRREADGPRTYAHISTGNYNTRTARQYTDYGLLTANPDIGHDLTQLFHFLTGFAPRQTYDTLVTAPHAMRSTWQRHIGAEIEQARQGNDARILLKMNELTDVQLIQSLYRASQAGVQIDLIVRGQCRVRPGVPGISEGIRVHSIVDRFLEHERVLCFWDGGPPTVYISSADWQSSRLDERVEVAVPITDASLRERILTHLEAALQPRPRTWALQADGRYVPTNDGSHTHSVQEMLMQRYAASES